MIAIQSRGVSSLFLILACDLRVRILRTLAAEPQCVTRLSENVGVRQQAISFHLHILRLRGLATYRRVGKMNLYRATRRGHYAVDLYEHAAFEVAGRWNLDGDVDLIETQDLVA